MTQIIDARSRRLLELSVEQTTSHAIIVMDPQGIVLAWLGAAETIFGFTADEALGRSLKQIFTPQDVAQGMDAYELTVAAAAGLAEDDRWHMRKDGSRIWATGAVSPIREKSGELLGFVKLVRDRTDLRARMETSESQVAALGKSRERTQLFVRTLGHELRNPLAPMSNAVQIIARLSTDQRVQAALQIISRQVATLVRLADDLMEVARLDIGRVVLDRRQADLRQLLQDAVDSVIDDATAKGVHLEAVLPGISLLAEVDEARLQRVVLNLVGNAIKYTPPGGNVWVTATQDAQDIVIKVEDTGMGIPPEMLPRIFELFTRSSGASDMAPSGLGVGLAIVKEIAEMHGGSVQARSAGVGKGAEFTLRIPMESGEAG